MNRDLCCPYCWNRVKSEPYRQHLARTTEHSVAVRCGRCGRTFVFAVDLWRRDIVDKYRPDTPPDTPPPEREP